MVCRVILADSRGGDYRLLRDPQAACLISNWPTTTDSGRLQSLFVRGSVGVSFCTALGRIAESQKCERCSDHDRNRLKPVFYGRPSMQAHFVVAEEYRDSQHAEATRLTSSSRAALQHSGSAIVAAGRAFFGLTCPSAQHLPPPYSTIGRDPSAGGTLAVSASVQGRAAGDFSFFPQFGLSISPCRMVRVIPWHFGGPLILIAALSISGMSIAHNCRNHPFSGASP
jgi:hypothetical protein